MKAFIKAYTYLNLGDDLFVKILADKYPEVIFEMIVHDRYKLPFENIGNIKLIRYPRVLNKIFKTIGIENFYRIFSRIFMKNTDITIHIGGSIFIQNDNNLNSAVEYEKDIMVSKKYCVLGANFGPYKNESYKEYYESLFKKIDDICFRDKVSFDMFPDVKNKRLAADIVFGMDTTNYIKTSTNEIVMVVINLKGRDGLEDYLDAYENQMGLLAKYYLDKNYKVTLMGFCVGENDEEAIDRIINKTGLHINKYLYEGDIEEALLILGQSSLIIASRFHAMVLGWKLQKKVYPISYSNKMENVLDEKFPTENYSSIEEFSKKSLGSIIEDIKNNSLVELSDVEKDAKLQFEYLNKILKGI